jgi:hypothetical protein
MSTRRRGLPPIHESNTYSLLDEMMASATEPLPAAQREERIKDARFHLEELATGTAPTRLNWKTIAMIGNIFNVMTELKMVDDPDNLTTQVQHTLKAVAERAVAGQALRLGRDEMPVVASLINAYEEVLEVLPHRDLIRALRETEKRVRVWRPGDFNANPAKHRKP